MEEEKNVENNGPNDKSVVKPRKSNEEESPKGVDMKNEVERKANDGPAKSARENVTSNEEDEPAGVSSSHAEIEHLDQWYRGRRSSGYRRWTRVVSQNWL
ncbi:hypothetical protein Tco_1387107 [Tanacetum coccineum]